MRRLSIVVLVGVVLRAFTVLADTSVLLQAYDASTGHPLTQIKLKQYIFHPPKEFWQGRTTEWLPQIEAADGVYEVRLEPESRGGIIIAKTGYYSARISLATLLSLEAGTTQKIFLAPKVNPISLIALRHMSHRQEDILPVDLKRYFDCLKADWLPPYGEGIKADIEFSITRYRKDGTLWDLFQVKFLNANDGFMRIEGAYADGMCIRECPKRLDLMNELLYLRENNKDVNFKQQDYVFRVRTQLTPSGEVLSAYYGKLYDAFYFNILEEGWMCDFEFYLNPTPNDRNLEFNGESLNYPKLRAHRVNTIR